jgi:hypothetical protein
MVTLGLKFSRLYHAFIALHSIILIVSSSGKRSGLNISYALSSAWCARKKS